jgi:imidazolonepropionase-like amidohydrolase
MNKIIFAVFLIGLSFSAYAQEEEVRKVTIIHAGTLLAVAGDNPIVDASIIIEEGKITDVVSTFVSTAGEAEVTIVDLSDKFVMSALIDAHIHMAEGDLNNPGANGADHAIMGVINSYKVLMAGFTTVRDLGARDDTLYKIIEGIESGEIIGPRIIPGGIIIGVGSRDNGLECNGVESCRRTTRDMIKAGAKWIKIRSSCRGGQLCSNEDGAPIFFDDEIKTIIDVAKKYNIPVATHSHTRDSSLQVLKFDIQSLEHGTFMNEAAMDIMIEKGVYYVPTMSNLDETEAVATNPDTDPIYAEHNMKFVTRHPKTLMMAYSKGVKIATGTDGDGRNAGTNYREVEYFVRSGIPNNDALKMATVNSAELLGFADSLGSIEKGKFADIIAINGNPLENIKDIENVTFVMKEGRVFKD